MGIDKWIVRTVNVVYNEEQLRMMVDGSLRDRFEVTVGVHRGSILSPLPFAIMLEAFFHECCTN